MPDSRNLQELYFGFYCPICSAPIFVTLQPHTLGICVRATGLQSTPFDWVSLFSPFGDTVVIDSTTFKRNCDSCLSIAFVFVHLLRPTKDHDYILNLPTMCDPVTEKLLPVSTIAVKLPEERNERS